MTRDREAGWALPDVRVDVVEDRSAGARADEGFLKVRRLVLRNAYPDGETSRAYTYDVVDRDALDAAVIVLVTAESPPRVCLRSSVRPPLAMREGGGSPALWEVPAGLLEPDEQGELGVLRASAREALEETGFALPPEAFTTLGPPVYLSPGVLGERIHFTLATIDPAHVGHPEGDGSPTEERAIVRLVPLAEALGACDDGRIEDAKTEVALRRLAARVRS